jgi:hypothetical protein
MAREVGDLWPQSSGSASLGAEMRNGGFTGEVRPFAHLHANSGVFYNHRGSSGVLRYVADDFSNAALQQIGYFVGEGFEFSLDGGKSFALGIQRDITSGQTLIHSDNGKRVVIVASGVTLFGNGQSTDISSYGAPISIIANLLAGRIDISSQESYVNITGGALADGTAFQNKGIKLATNYTNIALEAGVVGSNVGDILLSAWAASGQMLYRFGPHQSWHIKQSHSSTGGPANDGFWPIAHSGQVAAMIATSSGNMGNVNLQNAYYGGDEVLLKVAGTRSDGILLKMREVSRPMFPTDPIGDPGYGIAVSGFSHTPLNPHSYGIAYLGSNALSFQGSGVFGSNANLWIGIAPENSTQATISSSGAIQMSCSGFNGSYDGSVLHFVANGSYKIFADSLIQIKSSQGQLVAEGIGVNITATDPNNDSTGNFIAEAATQLSLDAFAQSGRMDYRFGPHQSWYIKTSHANAGGPFNDGFWPIAHSGNVNQMINAAISQINTGILTLEDEGGSQTSADAIVFQDSGGAIDVVTLDGATIDWYSEIVGVNGIGKTSPTDGFTLLNGAALSGLQAQYNIGDEILLTNRPSLTPRGVLVKYPVGARLPKPNDTLDVLTGYGIAVSGHSTTPTNLGSYAISVLAPNALVIHGSGQNSPDLFVGVDNAVDAARIHTSGVLRVSAGSGIMVTSPTVFAGSGTRPPLGVSGVFIPPTQVNRTGDMFVQNHGFLDVGIVNDQATASAKAMGVGELVMQTGSGTINVMIGSGIAQFLTLSVMKITAVEQNVPFSDINYLCADKNYKGGTEAAGTSGQITIFSPGLYKADFKVQATKTVGTNPQVCRYRALLNGTALLGATCNSFHFDASAAASNSAALSVLFTANAGDKFSVGILSSLDGADNCQLDTRAGLLILQRIGPKRSTF